VSILLKTKPCSITIKTDPLKISHKTILKRDTTRRQSQSSAPVSRWTPSCGRWPASDADWPGTDHSPSATSASDSCDRASLGPATGKLTKNTATTLLPLPVFVQSAIFSPTYTRLCQDTKKEIFFWGGGINWSRFIGKMSFLSPYQQCQSIGRKYCGKQPLNNKP